MDKTLQEIRDNFWVTEEWIKIDEPIIIEIFKNILKNFNEKKYYKGSLEELKLYIQCWENEKVLTRIGFENFNKLTDKLENNWVIPDGFKLQEMVEERKNKKSNIEDFKKKFPFMQKIVDRVRKIF